MLQSWIWFMHLHIWLPVLGLVTVQGLPTLQECCGIHCLHAICGHWVLCLWDHGCVVPRWVPLPPVVHQHQGHGRGQARSEQEAVHTEHDEVSWVCRNGALHTGGILVTCVCLHWLSHISSACNCGTGWLPDLIHLLHCKHSTSSPSMSYTMEKVSTAKCSHCVPGPDSVHLYWIYISSGICFRRKWHTSYNSNQIISGLFVSGILALLGYGLKSVLAQNTLTSEHWRWIR